SRTLHAGTCQEGLARMLGGGMQNCESIFSQPVNWVEPKPTDVSFSPTSGSVAGCTVVRLKGKFLASGTDDEMTIKVGGQDVKDYERIYGAEYDRDDTFQSYTQD